MSESVAVAECTLYIYKGAWGLPSFDPLCLAALAHCRALKLDFDVRVADSAAMSPTGTLPMVRVGSECGARGRWRSLLDTYAGAPSSTSTLASTSASTSASALESASTVPIGSMSADLSNAAALTSLAESELAAVLLFEACVLRDNFEQVWRPAWASALPFWAAYLVRSRQRAAGEAFASALGVVSEEDARERAAQLAATFAAVLGDAPFLGGDAPCSADFALFGQVAVALHAPWVDSIVGTAVRKHANLVAHEERVRRHCFGDKYSFRTAPHSLTTHNEPDPQSGLFGAWRVPIAAPRIKPLTRREYDRKRINFLFVMGTVALLGTFYLTSALALHEIPAPKLKGR